MLTRNFFYFVSIGLFVAFYSGCQSASVADSRLQPPPSRLERALKRLEGLQARREAWALDLCEGRRLSAAERRQVRALEKSLPVKGLTILCMVDLPFTCRGPRKASPCTGLAERRGPVAALTVATGYRVEARPSNPPTSLYHEWLHARFPDWRHRPVGDAHALHVAYYGYGARL